MNASKAIIVTVPFDSVDDLERQGIAVSVPVFRGAAVEALVTIGTDSAALVTLMQAPDALRAFAVWIREWCRAKGDSLEISVKRGNRRVRLTVDGQIDPAVVADFLVAALADEPAEPQAEASAS